MSESSPLTLEGLKLAVSRDACAFRCRCELQPAGGPGDKVFPPTYEGGQYAVETRRIKGQEVPCVLLDSVQSQANRMEEALLEAWKDRKIALPVIVVDFGAKGLPEVGQITSLDAPHRIADAILRDSLLDGKRFRESDRGKAIGGVSLQNATPLFELCPTALVYGMWDSTGPRGGMGAKFARVMVSEIVGENAVAGKKTHSRVDPLPISQHVKLYWSKDKKGWTVEESQAAKDAAGAPLPYDRGRSEKGKPGNPSKANLGNITPGIEEGGVTIDKALLTAVVSLPALRRLRFPLAAKVKPEVNDAARTVLAALGLCGAALSLHKGMDLRSRCLLVQTATPAWELVGASGDVKTFSLDATSAVSLLNAAAEQAKAAGLPWAPADGKPILTLTPSDDLVTLVKRSYELAATGQAEEGEE